AFTDMFVLYLIVLLCFFSYVVYVPVYFFFFFSSRRRHTRCYRDWSSDVCSSDLTFVEAGRQHYNGDLAGRWILTAGLGGMGGARSEERRVGKECRCRGWRQK